MFSFTLPLLLSASILASPLLHDRMVEGGAQSGFAWQSTKNLFMFGDSYTTTGWNISLGTDLTAKPSPGYTASDGPNWVEYLNSTYNASTLSTYNHAYGGSTIDSVVVVPYLPSVQSLKTQIGLFEQYLAPHPNNYGLVGK